MTAILIFNEVVMVLVLLPAGTYLYTDVKRTYRTDCFRELVYGGHCYFRENDVVSNSGICQKQAKTINRETQQTMVS